MKEIFYYCLHDNFINWATFLVICFAVYNAIKDLYKGNAYNNKIITIAITLTALIITIVNIPHLRSFLKLLIFGLGVTLYLALWYIISLLVTFIIAVLIDMLFKIINYVIKFLSKKGRS